jgi:Leucine-rich repeat (LRR) protein
MKPSVSISIVVVVCIFLYGTYFDSAAQFVAASESSTLPLEAKALLESGWWGSDDTSNTSTPCNWYGITCNADGSVTRIEIAFQIRAPDKLKLNFSSLPNLVHLDLSANKLQGSIPLEIGILSKLDYINLSYNNLTGELPIFLANLTQLVWFDISHNLIIGPISSSFWLLTNLTFLDMSYNQINSFMASEIGMLKNLVFFSLRNNMLIGPIPSTLGHLTHLEYLLLSSNRIHGSIPPKIGNMENLRYLSLENNNLSGPIPSTLSHLTHLKYLSLSNNRIDGSISPKIGNMKYLTYLSLENNSLSGSIPSTLSHLTYLEHLSLSNNRIDGSISPEIGNMKNLTYLSLENNSLSGSIPSTLGHLAYLEHLSLSNNQIDSSIPPEIGNMENLINLSLENNNLSGYVPKEMGNLKNLLYLTLESNNFIGSIPTHLTNCSSLKHLLLSNNSLSGTIPHQIQHLYFLHTINLSHNFISGKIPLELSSLANLVVLDLSYNNLSGGMPLSFTSVRNINLSYNSLVGQIPDSYPTYTSDTLIGNKDLCGDFAGFSPCHPLSPPLSPYQANNKSVIPKAKIIAPISIFLELLVLGGFCFFLSQRVVHKTQSMSTERKNGNLFSIWNYDEKIAYEDIIQATEDFDIKYCIGTGGYGSVYKAELPSGKVVALKKLHRLEAENPAFDKSFKNEIKVLIEIRHRNIIKLYGFCLHKRCMFLVYEYKERGSLFCVLNDDIESVELDWRKRVNIIKGIAHALSYMHHECIPAIVHRDISSNNILLNNKLEAFVSDFGTAKLLDPDSSNQTLVAGTYGYIAPGELLFSCYNLYLLLFSALSLIVKHRTSQICRTNIFPQYLY